MVERSAFDELIRRACRRGMLNLVLSQIGLAATVAMAGVILLLLLGTEILDWPWLPGLFLAGLAIGFYRIRRRTPSPYWIAQRIDHRLGLNDSLSTAFFFSHLSNGRRGSEEVTRAQRRRAEELSGRLDVKRAMPLTAPRTAYGAALLGLLAFGLFAIRYGMTRSLDLRPTFANVLIDAFGQPYPEVAATPDKFTQQMPDFLEASGLAPDATESPKTLSASTHTPQTGAESATYRQQARSTERSNMSQQDAGEELENSEGPDAEGDHFGKPTEGDQGSSRGRPPEAKQPPRTNTENSSLMNKLRDAMADLLSRLKIQPPSTESEQASDSTQGGFQSGRQRQTLSQKGSPGPDRQQSDRSSEMGQQGNQEGENSQGSQNARGDSRQGNSGQRSSDERSGIGKEDGSKELREAEQLAAMGKISEIIGKRSANVTGEVMVEVASGDEQQLKTQYSQSSARHSDVGGEIHRDEVPLIFQHYVQRYFEEVRKIPTARSAGTRADDR